MAIVAQLVRASDCGSEGRGFESPHSPHLLNSKTHPHKNIGFNLALALKAYL